MIRAATFDRHRQRSLSSAAMEVRDGMPYRTAVRNFRVPKSTVADFAHRENRTVPTRSHTALTMEEKRSPCNFIK
eukprot:IDg9699t1